MNIYREIFGYIGSILILVSMMMTSLVKLRIFNIIGSIISMTYSFICGAFPVVLLNVGIIIINVAQLIRASKSKHVFSYIKCRPDDSALSHFLEFRKNDILEFFPDFKQDNISSSEVYLVCADAEVAGVLMGKLEGDCLHIDIDYAAPKFRDGTLAKYLYPALKDTGITRFTASKNSTSQYLKYLNKIGFRAEDDLMVKNTLTEETVCNL